MGIYQEKKGIGTLGKIPMVWNRNYTILLATLLVNFTILFFSYPSCIVNLSEHFTEPLFSVNVV